MGLFVVYHKILNYIHHKRIKEYHLIICKYIDINFCDALQLSDQSGFEFEFHLYIKSQQQDFKKGLADFVPIVPS